MGDKYDISESGSMDYGSVSNSKREFREQQQKEVVIQDDQDAKPGRSLVPLIAAVALSGLGLLGISTLRSTNIQSVTNFFEDNRESNALVYKLYRNGYSPLVLDHPYLKYKFLDGVDFVIEPYATMNLLVDGAQSSYFYRFKICKSEDQSASSCSDGAYSTSELSLNSGAVTQCNAHDKLSVKIDVYQSSTDSSLVSSGVFNGMCMYVRREIRALTDTDRDAALDAMYMMWEVDEETGQKKYGENYHEAKWHLKFHHFNAAWQESDHVHEGNGFLPQHLKSTNWFELSMQAVDPSVSLPYWDFTMDSNAPIYEASVFTPEYFGSMPMPTDTLYGFTYQDDSVLAASIPDGRWAMLKTDMNDCYEDLKAGYGYMRAPWNMNPSPYITRFTSNMMIGTQLPTCKSHYTMLEYTDMMDYMYTIQNDAHATAHGLVGGTYGCDLFKPLLSAGLITDETNLLTICKSWVFYLKEFYRSNYIFPNKDCDASDPDNAFCGFTCVSGTTEELKQNLMLKIGANVPAQMSDEDWSQWTDFICDGDGQRIYSGDHLESASPADPSFWPIHPTLDRLTHAKMMSGGFENSNWATDTINDYVCAKANCYDASSSSFGYFDSCCMGHLSYSKLMDATTGNRNDEYGPTNEELLQSLDPTSPSYSVGYIYDSFDWSHCTEDFSALLDAAHEAASKPASSTSSSGTIESVLRAKVL